MIGKENLRKNLTGNMAFYSYLPCKMQEYDVIVDDLMKKQMERLHGLFGELNKRLTETGDEVLEGLMDSEAHASWILASGKRPSPFMIQTSGVADELAKENVNNIKRAYRYAREALKKYPLCSRLFCNIHYIVCESAAYDKKYRGEYRNSPVWIGKEGSSIREASFVPPVDSDMIEALSDLETFINYSDMDVFLKAAMIHYQFEMIHPFIDANGRVGRILNGLFLCEAGVLPTPVLLFSQALLSSADDYYQNIQYTNLSQDMNSWIRFFLLRLECGVRETLGLFPSSTMKEGDSLVGGV